MTMVRQLLGKLLPRLRRYMGVNVVFVLRRAHAGEPRRVALPSGLECRPLSEEEALAFAADPQLELSAEWVRAAYAREHLCVGALLHGALLGYTWLAFGDTAYEGGIWAGFQERLRYAHKSFVRPECRGQRILRALHARADRPELCRGRHFTVAFVNGDNGRSLAAFERSGFRVVGHAAYLKCFGALFVFRSAGVKRAGITLYKGDTRVGEPYAQPIFSRQEP